MYGTLTTWFNRTRKQAPHPRQAKPTLETLEDRRLLSSLYANLGSDGVLLVRGTDNADTITIKKSDSRITVNDGAGPITIGSPGHISNFLNSADVRRIVVNAGGGHDVVRVTEISPTAWNRSIPVHMDGGAGDDQLHGGSSNDRLFGGYGKDRLFGNGGHDTLVFSRDLGWGFGAKSASGFTLYTSGRSLDIFDGGTGTDRIELTANQDGLVFDDGFPLDGERQRIRAVEQVFGNGANDVIDFGSYSISYMNYDVANLTLRGGGGNDHLAGNAATVTTLHGESGVDELRAGNRRDALYGGSNLYSSGATGSDRLFVFAGQAVVNGGETVRIRVPTDQPQNDGWSCGPNSASRLLRAYGQNVSYAQARSFTRHDGNLVSWATLGTPPSALLDTLRHWKPDSSKEERSNLQRVIDLLKQSKPVIALVSLRKKSIFGGSVGVLHYVVLSGVDTAAQRLHYVDTDGVAKSWTYAQFEAKWTWADDFSGVTGEIAQGGVELLGLRQRTILF